MWSEALNFDLPGKLRPRKCLLWKGINLIGKTSSRPQPVLTLMSEALSWLLERLLGWGQGDPGRFQRRHIQSSSRGPEGAARKASHKQVSQLSPSLIHSCGFEPQCRVWSKGSISIPPPPPCSPMAARTGPGSSLTNSLFSN